jgi:hypothetical protein
MAAFWDTSAIIHICVPGQSASAAKRILSRHAVVVWWTARVEVRSTLERLRKEAAIIPRVYNASRDRLEALLASWRETQPTESLRELACVQLERFAIRAADALHLGAALIWCSQKPRGRLFICNICNNLRFGDAARQAGFTVDRSEGHPSRITSGTASIAANFTAFSKTQ